MTNQVPVWEVNMNAEQLQAIRHVGGPIRLLAQAGSGKTRALVHRIARLVAVEGVAMSEILAVTFSKKAADEMAERLKALGVEQARVGTWHSLCLQILKDDDTEWARWTVDEKNAAKYVVKDVIGYQFLNWRNADLGKVCRYIGFCKANLEKAGSPEAALRARQTFGREWEMGAQAYETSQRIIEERGILTFDDMLVYAHQHLSTDEDARRAWAGKWEYVMQDEAQDANRAQKEIARLLAKDHQNYMVVGDVAQSIFGFRGSTPSYLADFEQEWPGAKTIIMSRNYRSGDAIVAAANEVIRPASVRVPCDMSAERGVAGEVRTITSANLDAEGVEFARFAKEIVHNGGGYGDVTALFRTNAQSRALEEALLGAKIPYVVVGGTSFYERREVKDILGYLRVAVGSGDQDALKRCINAPFRFLGRAFVERVIIEACRGQRTPDFAAVVDAVAKQQGLQARQRESAAGWVDLIVEVRRMVQAAASPAQVLGLVVERSRYLEWLEKEEGVESLDSSQVSNVRELLRVAERFATAADLLAYIEETMEAARRQRADKQAGGDRVLLMSIHRSKGLEWPHVFVCGMNEAILPHVMGDPEEERRLAYVAFTRARETLVLSTVVEFASRAGMKRGVPSRFLPTPHRPDLTLEEAAS